MIWTGNIQKDEDNWKALARNRDEWKKTIEVGKEKKKVPL